jgi:hypothetical protein
MARTPTHNAHAKRAKKAMELAKALYLADGGHLGRERREFDKWLDATLDEMDNAHQSEQVGEAAQEIKDGKNEIEVNQKW